jgi:hypothetical protein
MLKHLYLILGSTLIFGIISGIVLFLYNNTGKEGDGGLETSSRGFTIIAYEYGGCMSLGCSSYRIANNGAYMYITRDAQTGEDRFEDVLSGRQLGTLRTLIGETNLRRALDTSFTGTCPITYDGVAYRFDITYKGERYELDSCRQSLDGVPLFDTLSSYFEIFRITRKAL